MKDHSRDFSLYIHVPFCVSKCAYCDFLSFADRSGMKDYFSALCAEIREKAKTCDRIVDNIFFGGGTPSLAYNYFPMLKEAIFGSFRVKESAEISMECNPESVSAEFIRAAKDLGVNRVSVGVQTLSDPLLKIIGRAHDRKMALQALAMLTAAFPSVNADVMLALPRQRIDDLDDTLDALFGYPIDHLSCYSLILEEGTPLYRAAERREFTIDEDFSADLYDHARKRLAREGFSRYEISNFCKGEAVCAYNASVWQYADYLGLGLGASSFMKSEQGMPALRSKNTSDLSRYIATCGREKEDTPISLAEGEKEFIMLGLRQERGMDLLRFRELFGVDFLSKYGEKVKKNANFIEITSEKVAIRPPYFYISNYLIGEII